jgi:hypothetical protein
LKPYWKDEITHDWRVRRYWNEECDNVFKSFTVLFQFIYNHFGGTHRKPGEKMYMTQDEFDNFVMTANLVNDLMMAREISLVFNLGI